MDKPKKKSTWRKPLPHLLTCALLLACSATVKQNDLAEYHLSGSVKSCIQKRYRCSAAGKPDTVAYEVDSVLFNRSGSMTYSSVHIGGKLQVKGKSISGGKEMLRYFYSKDTVEVEKIILQHRSNGLTAVETYASNGVKLSTGHQTEAQKGNVNLRELHLKYTNSRTLSNVMEQRYNQSGQVVEYKYLVNGVTREHKKIAYTSFDERNNWTAANVYNLLAPQPAPSETHTRTIAYY